MPISQEEKDSRFGTGAANGIPGLLLSLCYWIGDSIWNWAERGVQEARDREFREKEQARIKDFTERFADFRAYELCPKCLEWGFFPFVENEVEYDRLDGKKVILSIIRQCSHEHCKYMWEQK